MEMIFWPNFFKVTMGLQRCRMKMIPPHRYGLEPCIYYGIRDFRMLRICIPKDASRDEQKADDAWRRKFDKGYAYCAAKDR